MSAHAARTVARNSAFNLVAQIAIKALSFLFTVYVVRDLGPESYGTYAAIGAFGFLFIFIADLGLSPYGVREVARLRDQSDAPAKLADLHSDLLALRVLLSILAGGLTVGFGALTGRPELVLIALALNAVGLTLHGAQSASGTVLGGLERMGVGAGALVFSQLVFIAAGAFALWNGWGYLGLITANLLAITLSTIVVLRAAASVGWGSVSPARWLPLIRASLPFGIVTFALGLSYKFDTVLLELTRPAGETGLYNAAYNLVFTSAVLSNILNVALYPALARLSVTAPERLPGIYARALRYLWLLALPIAVGGAVLAGDLVPFLFDSDYTAGGVALRIVIWVVPLMYTSEFLGYVVLIGNQERRVARAVVISTALNVTLNLIIVPIFGFVGAAVTTVITEAVLVAQYVWLLRARLGALPLGQMLARPALAALGMGLLVAWLPAEWPVLLRVAAGVGLYGGLGLALGLITPDDWRFLRQLRRAEPQASEPPADPHINA